MKQKHVESSIPAAEDNSINTTNTMNTINKYAELKGLMIG